MLANKIKKILAQREKQTIVPTNAPLAPAAVLLPLYEKEGEYYILLTKRTQKVEHHKGQISFPGGARHEQDRDLVDTALRETFEEIGVRPEDVEILGEGRMEMREALLYEKLPGSRVRCHTCQWQCTIGPGKLGVCRMYQNNDGVLYTLNYAEVSSVGVDPIEKKPLFHFFPGSLVYSLGTWGCNFHCKHCQNWQISCADPAFFGAVTDHLSA
ncbi:unnamed protein product, partial [marine sediment metagenome]